MEVDPNSAEGWSQLVWMLVNDYLSHWNEAKKGPDESKKLLDRAEDAVQKALTIQWLKATEDSSRRQVAAEIQQRAFEIVPYVPTGQFYPMTAYRNNVKGVITGPALFMWNVEKV